MTEIIRDKEYYMHRVLDVLVPGSLLLALIVACASLPQPEKRGIKYSKRVSQRSEMIVNTNEDESTHLMNSTELQNFSLAVQDLISDDWHVNNMAMNGTITIGGSGIELDCAALGSSHDHNFTKYDDIADIAKELGIENPEETILIWGKNVGILPRSKGGADLVDTDETVWACLKR